MFTVTFGCSRCEICFCVHVSDTNPHIASGSTGHHAQQTHRVRQTPHRYHSINYCFQLVSWKSSVTDKAVRVYSMSHCNYIWIGECRLGRLGSFRYSERKDSSSNWLWINMQIQEYYIKFPLLSEGRGGPGTYRRPGMPHGVFEKWIRRSRLLRLSSQLSAWRRDDLCKQRGDRQGKRERRALGMDRELWNERTDNVRSLSAKSTLGDSNATLALKNGANLNTSELSFSRDCHCL